MELNSTLNQNVDTLFTNLESFTQKEGVIGKPITYDNKTFMPVISIALGYGGGNSSAKNQQGNAGSSQSAGMGAGGLGADGMGALGLGAKISTDAVIVIDNGNVSMISVNTASSATSQLINKIPQMFTGSSQSQASGQQNQSQGNQQGQKS